MWGTLVNAAAIVVGSIVGTVFNRSLPERFQSMVFQAMGLFVMILGISMALEMKYMLLCVLSLLLGGLFGELLRLDVQMSNLGEWLKRKLNAKNSRFSEGFVSTSLLYCIGAMSILGSIEEGSGQYPTLLLTKSVMDGFSAVAFASAMGIGVLFSFVPVAIYQGSLTLLAMSFGEMLSGVMINELSALGGVLLVGLGINLLEIRQIKVVNLLPSLVFIIVMVALFT